MLKKSKKNEKRKTEVVIAVAAVVIMLLSLIYPSVYDHLCKNRTYEDLSADTNQIMSANIRIIDVRAHDNIKSYGVGASGVIIERDDQRYYALTAAHVVEDGTRGYLACTVNTPAYAEYRKTKNADSYGHIPTEEYYSIMPKTEVEYISDKADLAVVSFECDEDLVVATVSDTVLSKGDRIVCIGNPSDSEEHFVKSYGKIKSDQVEFATDKRTDTVLKHSAYEAPGSSGSAVYDESMKLAGINVGGGTDVFGRFKFGAMIPADRITECIEDWHSTT